MLCENFFGTRESIMEGGLKKNARNVDRGDYII